MQTVQVKPDLCRVGLEACPPSDGIAPMWVGWCTDVLLNCDALTPPDPSILAAVAKYQIKSGGWPAAADKLLNGLKYGYPVGIDYTSAGLAFASHVTVEAEAASGNFDGQIVRDHLKLAAEALALQATCVR